jgi:uncharacterized protein (DUF302 family)
MTLDTTGKRINFNMTKENTMRIILLTIFSLLFSFSPALADNGVVTIKSNHSVKATADNLERVLNDKGMTLFTRINHSASAQKIGKELRPTELLVFGNPKIGTPLMQCSQTVAIDLPQKAIIWEDEAGQVWYSYNSPNYLKDRHAITGCDEVIKKVESALANFAKASTGP